MNSGTAGTIFSAALHAAAIGAALLLSARGGNEVVSAADPLLAILADADADPTKDAGLVGEARGPAEGVPDRSASPEASLPENDFSFSEMEALTRASEKALETPLPDPEPPAPVPAEARPAASVPANPAPAKASAEKKPRAPEKKPAAASPGKKSGSDTPKKMSFADWRKRNAGGKNVSSGRKTSGGSPSRVRVSGIDVSKIGVGGGSGARFGVPGGTGGNGGDGGRGIASARQVYGAEIARKLEAHLDDVLTQSPLKLERAVSATVRLGVDASGNVRLLEVLGAADPQVRERVARAVARIGKFRRPPEGRAFEIQIPDVVLRPLL